MMTAALAIAALMAAQPAPQPQPQTQPTQPQAGTFVTATPETSTARPEDVASIDSIVEALYDVISGPAGEKRDWARMRSLFADGARLMPHGAKGLRVGSVEDYIARSGPLLEGGGFFEREIGRTTDAYADIAQVFSTYEARKTENGPPMMRGINSIQLVRHGGRWWVVSLLW